MAKLMRAWRWWKGRGWVALLVLAAGMLVFRLGWGWVVQRQLGAKLAELRGRGEPVALQDVSYPPLKDGENAWKFQIKAIMALNPVVDCPRSSSMDYGDPPYPPAWMT